MCTTKIFYIPLTLHVVWRGGPRLTNIMHGYCCCTRNTGKGYSSNSPALRSTSADKSVVVSLQVIGTTSCVGMKLEAEAVEFTLSRVSPPSTLCSALFTTRLKLPSVTGACALVNNWLPVVVTQSSGPTVVTQVITTGSFAHKDTLPDRLSSTEKNKV